MISVPFGSSHGSPANAGMASGEWLADATKMAQMRADFVDFYDREYLAVIRFVMRCGASRQDAEDAAQDAFVAAWKDLLDRITTQSSTLS